MTDATATPKECTLGEIDLTHEATALVRAMMRDGLRLHVLAGFIARNPAHEKALQVTDPKRWEARFAEIIGGLSPEARERVSIPLGLLTERWFSLDVSGRNRQAMAVCEAIVRETTAARDARERAAVSMATERVPTFH